MKFPKRKSGLLALALIIFLCLNYNPQLNFKTNYLHWGWNLSLLTAILVLILFRLRNPADWKQILGINFTGKDWSGFLITTIILLVVSCFLVSHLSALNGFAFRPKLLYFKDYFPPASPFFPVLGEYIYYIPETFNEEILIGAFLLMGLERRFKRLDVNSIAIGIALLFSLMHQAMYKWSPVQSGILLTTWTVLTLFFVGILRNALILKTRKIAYSWAIHLSFNLIFFSGFYINTTTQEFAGEPERFNIVFGNITMVIITGFLAILSMIWLNLNRFKTANA